MPDNDRAIGSKQCIAPSVIAVQMRIDKITDWQRGERRDGRLDFVMHRRELAIHDDHAVLTNRDGDVAADALEHVGAMAEIERLHHGLGKVWSGRWRGLLLADGWSRKADNGSGHQASAEFSHRFSLSDAGREI